MTDEPTLGTPSPFEQIRRVNDAGKQHWFKKFHPPLAACAGTMNTGCHEPNFSDPPANSDKIFFL
jgi:hypothetical protein